MGQLRRHRSLQGVLTKRDRALSRGLVLAPLRRANTAHFPEPGETSFPLTLRCGAFFLLETFRYYYSCF